MQGLYCVGTPVAESQIRISNSSTVGQAGLGKDIWTLEFDKITEILKVWMV